MAAHSPENLAAVVDMGSNAIRFTITDLSPSQARLLPVVYDDRASISLYDAQASSKSTGKQPIPQETQEKVIHYFLRFKVVCSHYGLTDEQVHVVATEAVRLLSNSDEFCSSIKSATGWSVQCLTPTQEAFYGVAGVASCAASVTGIVIDMGGGSCQISWVNSKKGKIQADGDVYISLPYGSASLTKRLDEALASGDQKVKELQSEVSASLSSTFTRLQASPSFTPENIKAYVCGGGLRGWGYFLMSLDHEYPIPLIDGLEVTLDKFDKGYMDCTAEAKENEIFGLSKRRKKHLNAIAFLTRMLGEHLELIVEKVRFCQASIREGLLFDNLKASERSQDPLVVATNRHAPRSASGISQILFNSLPQTADPQWRVPEVLDKPMARAIANMMYANSGMVKQYRARMALRCTTEGDLTLARGLSHQQRAVLAIALCERWNGNLLPEDKIFLDRLQRLAGPEATWWSRYLGRIAALIGWVCPDGVLESPKRTHFTITETRIIADDVVDGVQLVRLLVELNHRGDAFDDEAEKAIKRIKAMGKYENYAPVWNAKKKAFDDILKFGMRVTVIKMEVPEHDLEMKDDQAAEN